MKTYAGLGARCVAFFIDALFLCVAWIGIVAASSQIDVSIPGWTFVAFAAIYFTLLTASPWEGSLGKKSLFIKVTDAAGNRIGPGRALLRFLATCVTLATAGVGFLLAGWTPRRRALHDFIAGTVVADANAPPERIAAELPPPIGWGSRIGAVVGMALIVLAVDTLYEMYQAVILRDKTDEMLQGFSVFKMEVAQALNEHRAVPATSTKLPLHAKKLTASPDGTIVLETADDLFENGRYVFKPALGASGVVSWSCSTERIETKYLPATCR